LDQDAIEPAVQIDVAADRQRRRARDGGAGDRRQRDHIRAADVAQQPAFDAEKPDRGRGVDAPLNRPPSSASSDHEDQTHNIARPCADK
jgi:hypothetical protein